MKVRFVDAAREEMFEAADYLEDQEAGLGDRFLDEVDDALALIEHHPRAWQEIVRGLRRCRLMVFRYGLIYRLRGDEIENVAVAHDRRRPRYWRDRLT
jgi:plasmid stabilization system protein ParE